ncbi:type I restriction endonuclease subunit R [Tissierella carlieri]|uniref:type I restriction endonuclease subunit R n=1 Tax=Tissierella carlieri TaxID=689904 RepID=UPI001C1165CA|nr:type I restriction endonuclease subunit R [Tissierella carlieri]MBU5312129.1 type I restriction endonuclease subunit R [Tissierella carlieri]MDD4549391.1 type I restriction endonuclease subunit R [Syntrophomonadaceae bacterium]
MKRGDTVRRAEAYDEMNISQIPALEVLNKIGYTIISPEKAEQMRGNLYNVVLKDILYERLTAINSFDFKGCTYKFSEKNIQQAILDIEEALTDGLIKTNEKIYDSLILGRSYPESLSEMDGTKSFNLNYIDWENPENNVFHVVEEFSVEREDGQGTVRPDIVTFINGIPFGVIECKKASISISQGISQMLRNQGKEYIPQLFKFVQIVMVTNKNETQYATTGTPKKFWSLWKEDKESIEYKWFEETLAETVTCRIPTVQDKNIISLFHPKRVIEIIRFFTLYDKNIKKIARYQQYFAIKEIIRTIVETDRNGNRQSGVIWHTQGSGKSLTMVMLSRYILSQFADIHPQVLVITDRIELDSQIHQTFNHSRLRAERAISGRHLVELINNNGADIITSLVHKFDTASKHQKPVKSKNIFVLIDESHRTQYGELNIKMKKVFPNACYLGFTGTPLMKKDKSTMKKFGGRMIHKYTIKDGVEDGAIVPLLYEGRLVEQTVNRNAIDKRIEMITRNLAEKQAEELKKKWSKFEAIASSEQRIRLIADDIYVHYTKFYKDTFAKAMLATASKFDAIRYKESFDEYGDLKTAIVISPPDQREGYDEVDEEPKDRVLKFWNKMMEAYSDPQKYEDHIKSEFIDGDELEILIVVDKLLTGFDAPRASVLYVDKPMKEHTLLQAIARVNRLYEGKDFGLIVDYRGLIQELDSAMRTYSGAGLENFDGKDLEGALVDVISIVGKLRESYSNVVAIFKGIKNKQDKEEYELLLGDEALRNDFYNQLSNFGKYLGIALESEHVYNAIGEDDIKLYKREFKFYQELRASVKLRYSDTIDHKEYEAKMRNLMDTYIAAEDIIQITAPVDILNEKEFEDELMRLGSPRAKADAIRTRMTKRISEKWDENPAYYKKFSERIEEIIEQYKEKRISELEYLEKMRNVMNDFRKGYSGTTYPEKIKHNIHAQAFYGVVKEVLEDERYYEAGVTELVAEDGPIYNYEGILADIAMEVDVIIERHCKVDWHDNPDVHKKISQEIDELLYLVKKKHFPKMTFDQIDTMIENIKTVALRRY